MTAGELGQEPEEGEPQEPADGTEKEPDQPVTGDEADGGPVDLAGMYAGLTGVSDVLGFDPNKLGIFDDIQKSIGAFTSLPIPSFLTESVVPLLPHAEQFRIEPIDIEDFEVDDSPWRTADAAEATAEAAKETAAYTGELLKAMRESVILNQQAVMLNEQTRQDNIAAQRFTRRMSVASLVLSIAGVIFAGVALLFAAQPSQAPVVNVPPDPAPTINVTVVPTPGP